MTDQENEEQDIPILLQQCITIYDGMMEEAEEPIDPETQPWRWEGMLTKLFAKLDNAPTSNYTRVVNMLKSMGCIEQIRRGAGRTASVWVLWQKPTVELFSFAKDAEREPDDPKKGIVGHDASLEQRVRDLTQMCLDLREKVLGLEQHILDIFENVDEILPRRIDNLEAMVLLSTNEEDEDGEPLEQGSE